MAFTLKRTRSSLDHFCRQCRRVPSGSTTAQPFIDWRCLAAFFNRGAADSLKPAQAARPTRLEFAASTVRIPHLRLWAGNGRT
jgi:hypothetical protein